MGHYFQTMPKGAKLSMFVLVFYWQQIFVFGIFLWKAGSRAAHWLGAAYLTNLWWGIWKTLRLCGACLTGHGSHSQPKIYRMITNFESFFCQLYANTFPLVKLIPFGYSAEILQPPGCEILVYVPLQLSELCCAISHLLQVMLMVLKPVALLWGLLN